MPRMMQQGTMWSCQLNTMCQSVQPPRGNIAIISHAEGYAPDVYTSILTNLSVCRSSKHFQTMASSLQVNASESKTVDISHVWAPQASIPGCWETETASFIYLPLVDYSAACMVCGNDIPQYCKKRQQICLGLAAHAYSSTDWSDRSYAPPASQWWLLVMSWNADRATMLVQNWIELEVASWRSSQPFDSAKRWEPMLQRH